MPSVRFHLPAQPLRQAISTYYSVTVPDAAGTVEDLLHPEWANIRFILGGRWSATLGEQHVDPVPEAVLVGPTSRSVRIRGTGPTETFGVGVLPLGWAQLVGGDASAFADRIVPLTAVFGPDAGQLVEGLRACPADERPAFLDRFFLARLEQRPAASDRIAKAHNLLVDPEIDTAEAFASRLRISPRHLERICRRAFGFPPKLLLRRQRFLRTLSQMRDHLDRPWAELIDAGYHDQPHFIRDFHRFMGMSPSRYFALPRRLLEPAGKERTKLLGTSLQGLHGAPMLTAGQDGR